MPFDDDRDILPRPSSIPYYAEAWLKAVRYWDADQKGWYHELLIWSAVQGEPPGYLPSDEEELKRIAGYEDPTRSGFGLVALSISSLALETYVRGQEEKWAKVRKKFRTCKENESFVYNPKMLEAIAEATKAAQGKQASSQVLGNNSFPTSSISKQASSRESSHPVSSKALPLPGRTTNSKWVENTETVPSPLSKEDAAFENKDASETSENSVKHSKVLETTSEHSSGIVQLKSNSSSASAENKSIVDATWKDDLSLPSRALPSQSRLYDCREEFDSLKDSSRDSNSSSEENSNLSKPLNPLSSPYERRRPTLDELREQVEEEKKRKRLEIKLIRSRKSREPTLFDEKKFFLDDGLIAWLKEKHPELDERDYEFLREQFCNSRSKRVEISWRRQFHTYVNNALKEYYIPFSQTPPKSELGANRNGHKYESAIAERERLSREEDEHLQRLRSGSHGDSTEGSKSLQLPPFTSNTKR